MEISDDDKLILNGEMFFSVRKFIRQKKSSDEIIAKVEEMINEGANINACDSNDKNNTILHVAAQKEQKGLVIFLLEKGANFFYNAEQKTPVHLALQNNTNLGKEIAEILCTNDKSASCFTNQNLCQQENHSETTSLSDEIKNIIKDSEITYPKRAGTSGVSGQFYETKLLSLVLHRGLHDKEIGEFYLAANIKDIGDFDDVCFRLKNVVCFMQTKHRENTDKAKLTVSSVRSNTGKLGLGIYFDSFIKIRQKFSPTATDPMFKGKFEEVDSYFVLYTPLKESFERKLKGNKQMSNKIHEIISTGEKRDMKGTDIFQFDYETHDLDFLTNYVKYEQIKVLAKSFLEFILSNNKLEVMMANDLVKIYHPTLAQKVVLITKVLESQNPQKNRKIQSNAQISKSLGNPNKPCYIHMAKFRPEFFYTEDHNLNTIKDTLFKEIVYTHSPKTSFSKDEIKQKIHEISCNPSAVAISELIGSPLKFDDTNDKLSLDINKLPKNKYKSDEIQQIKYELQKIQVTRTMIRDAVYIAGQKKLEMLNFQLPASFGNIDLATNQKTIEGVHNRLDFLAGKFKCLIEYYAERNKNKQIKTIEINNDVVGPGKILEVTHLNSNGGIGGAVGNLLQFDAQNEIFAFNTKGKLGENATYVLTKLKGFISEDLNNYRIKVDVDGFPRVSFETYQYDKKIAADFLSKLWFYTNQAQEESVEATVKKEINLHYNADHQRNQFLFHVHADAIFLRFHDEVQKWWKKQTEAHYLTKTTTIFEKAKKGIVDSPLLTVLNVMFIRKIKKFGIEFIRNIVDRLSLHDFCNKEKSKVLNIVSDAVILSAAKIMQSSTQQNKYTFINLDYVHILPKNDYKTMMEEIKALQDVTIVIMSEKPLSRDLQDTLSTIMTNFTNPIHEVKTQIIIVTLEPIQISHELPTENYVYITFKDNNVNLTDLTLESQNYFLDRTKIIYQGDEVNLKSIIDEGSKDLITGKLMWSLLNKEKVEIGYSLYSHKYDEIKNYYISRPLKCDDEEYVVDSLDDIDQKIVLISSKPRMGKSILLTHLSLQTKKVDVKPWIVRINLSPYDKNIAKIKSKDLKAVMTFLCSAALQTYDSTQKVHFSEIDNETVVIIKNDCEEISFELQLFVHFYNCGHVIFLFDGFDKIYPNYTNESIELFSMLERANKRAWVTGDNFVIRILESQFGSSYKLGKLSNLQQKSFLQRFWACNLKLDKLNHEQFHNIILFFNYILRIFKKEIDVNDVSEEIQDRLSMPLLSVPLHLIYLTVLDYFKNDVHSLSPCYFRETIKKKWRLDSYTPIDHMLGRSKKENSLELAGTPLHMYIAANYFVFQITDKFDLHPDPKMFLDRSNMIINTVTLYEKFLKVNIKNISEKNYQTSTEDDQEKLRNEFFSSHKKLALYALCKEKDISKFLTESEIREVKQKINLIESGAYKTELIDCVVDGVPRFHHVIFAEYFCVEALTDLLKYFQNPNWDRCPALESILDFIVNIALVCSPPGLRNSFEYKLKYDPEIAETLSNDKCQKIIFNLLLKPNNDRDAYSGKNALDIAIDEGLVNITNVLLTSVRSNVTENNFNKITTILKSSANILEAVDTSRSIVSEDVLRCMQNVDGENLIKLLSRETRDNICENVKTNVVEPIKKITELAIEVTGNNENLVAFVQEFPNHLPDFIRSIFKK